ncbi:MAG: hypothetical protein HQL20_02790 [Candidatus Omnitrophica bacterium]|nr:hypothetical protein [Candidatus Omnitrophota bacterium]
MHMKYLAVLVVAFLAAGCGVAPQPPGPVVFSIDGYNVTLAEFNEGFEHSEYAEQENAERARAEYGKHLIAQKLVLLDALKKGIDKDKEFLKAVERVWEQSLTTTALGVKTREIKKSLTLSDAELRRFYENMVKEGITTKDYKDVYPQIKLQAQKQMESRLLDEWMTGLHAGSKIVVNKNFLKFDK